DEFAFFIGEGMRKDPVLITQETQIQKLLEYYMGKNTPQRQVFIIDNLRVEKDLPEELGVEVGAAATADAE
ncbi:MAG: type IIA DNA topoisomerase subunit B, partial [Chitinophagia bacterium]|nr:type IIA DNA topoisomerase subunit B [Chitinophagia bacterium]